MLAVPAALLGSGEHYALEVAGDSMVEAGILDGDFALVRRTDVARDGEIVVALIDDVGGDAQVFPSRGRDGPPRSRQPRLRSPALSPAAGPHPGQALGYPPPLRLSHSEGEPRRPVGLRPSSSSRHVVAARFRPGRSATIGSGLRPTSPGWRSPGRARSRTGRCAERDRHARRSLPTRLVEPQPARAAAARQRRSLTTMSARRHAAISSPARHQIARCASPAPASAARRARASARHRSPAAPRRALLGQQRRLAIDPAVLRQHVAGIVARPVAQQRHAPSRSRTATCRPSPVTSRSGAGVSSAQAAPDRERQRAPAAATASATARSTARPRPSARKRRVGIAGQRRHRSRAPPRPACASHSSPRSARPASHHTGAPSPARSSTSASASSGMTTKVVSGIATMLASAPYSPALWKWYTAIGISAASTSIPVASSDTSPRPSRRDQPLLVRREASRRPADARAARRSR